MARCEDLVPVEELLGRELTDEDIKLIRFKADMAAPVLVWEQQRFQFV
jgi:hypothetical protein